MRRIVSVTVFVFVMAALTTAQDVPKIINGGVLNGKAVSLPKPAYPEEAKKARFGGMVKVRVVIDENGNVVEAEATRETLENEPAETTALYNLLGEAAEKAAFDATFSPTRLSGQPVKVSGVITYNFMAKPDESEDSATAINGGILNGKAYELPAPKYPAAAKAVKASGLVTVEIVIDENGDVISAAAVSGHPLLRSSATEAAQEAKFRPTRLEGKPVRVSGVLTYHFVLPDAGTN